MAPGQEGIHYNAIALGWINFDLSNEYINVQDNPQQALKGLHTMHPIDRTGEPEYIGAMVYFLDSEQDSFVTGQIVVVNAVRTAKLLPL